MIRRLIERVKHHHRLAGKLEEIDRLADRDRQ